MSLIDEALRQAQKRAREQENPAPPNSAPAPRPNRSARPLTAGIVLGVVITAVAAGSVYLLSRRKTSMRPAAVTSATYQPRGTKNEVPRLATRTPVPLETEFVPPPPANRAPKASTALANLPSTPPPAPAAKPQKSETVPRGEMTYAGEVIFGSTRITLDGIVYSATHPVALINGMVISEGMAIGDYTVEKIEPSRVKFRGPKESFYIRVR